MDLTKFKHSYSLTVRNYEIDWQGIVHNANYLLYFEVARVDYFKHVGMEIDERSINGKIKIVVVRNELDYYNSATFDDRLTIYTRISAINNSSIICEGIMVNQEKKKEIAKNVCVLVWIDPVTNTSAPVPLYFRKRVQQYEGADAQIQFPSIEV